MRVVALILLLNTLCASAQGFYVSDHDKRCYISQELTKAVAVSIKTTTGSGVKAVLGGFFTSVMAGLTKEVYDAYKPNKTGFDKKHLFSNGWGSLVGSMQVTVYFDISDKKARSKILD